MKKQKSLTLSFFFCLITSFFGGLFSPFLPIHPFSPFLVQQSLFRSKTTALWTAASCGFITDLICSKHRFGFYALCFSGIVTLLYRYKRYFIENHILTLPLLSSTLAITLAFFEWMTSKGSPYHFLTQLPSLILTEFLYALICFTLPEKLYRYLKKISWKGRFRKILPKRFRSMPS